MWDLGDTLESVTGGSWDMDNSVSALQSFLSDQVSAFISGFSPPGQAITIAGPINPNK